MGRMAYGFMVSFKAVFGLANCQSPVDELWPPIAAYCSPFDFLSPFAIKIIFILVLFIYNYFLIVIIIWFIWVEKIIENFIKTFIVHSFADFYLSILWPIDEIAYKSLIYLEIILNFLFRLIYLSIFLSTKSIIVLLFTYFWLHFTVLAIKSNNFKLKWQQYRRVSTINTFREIFPNNSFKWNGK